MPITIDQNTAWAIRGVAPDKISVDVDKITAEIAEIRLKAEAGAQLSPQEELILKSYTANPEKFISPAIEPSVKPAIEPTAITDEDIKNVVDKLEKNESLSEAEIKIAAQFAETEIPVEKTVVIGGQEYKESDLKNQMLTEYNLKEVSIPPESIEKMFDDYKLRLNKSEWMKSQTQKSQDLATVRIEVGKMTTELMAQSSHLKSELTKVNELKSRLTQLAGENIIEDDIYDTETGRANQDLLLKSLRIKEAREQLPFLEEEEKRIVEQLQNTERETTKQRIRDLQIAHPEYQTSQDVQIIAQQYVDGNISVEDEDKFTELIDIIRLADSARITPERQHNIMLRKGQLAIKIKPAANGISTTLASQPYVKKVNTNQELLAKIKAKQSVSKFLEKGKKLEPTPVDQKSKKAWEIREGSSQTTLAGLDSDSELAKLGY